MAHGGNRHTRPRGGGGVGGDVGGVGTRQDIQHLCMDMSKLLNLDCHAEKYIVVLCIVSRDGMASSHYPL